MAFELVNGGADKDKVGGAFTKINNNFKELFTGGTFDSGAGELTLEKAFGGSTVITGFGTGSGTAITGGTFNYGTQTLTLTNSTGGTINVIGFADVNITGGSLNLGSGTLILNNNTGGTISVTGFTDVIQVDDNASSFSGNTDSDLSTDVQTILRPSVGDYSDRYRLADDSVLFIKMRNIDGDDGTTSPQKRIGTVIGNTDDTSSGQTDPGHVHMQLEGIPDFDLTSAPLTISGYSATGYKGQRTYDMAFIKEAVENNQWALVRRAYYPVAVTDGVSGVTDIDEHTDFVKISNTAALQVNLQKVSDFKGRYITFYKDSADAFAITLTADGSELINNSSTNAEMDAQGDTITLYCDGVKYMIVSKIIN